MLYRLIEIGFGFVEIAEIEVACGSCIVNFGAAWFGAIGRVKEDQRFLGAILTSHRLATVEQLRLVDRRGTRMAAGSTFRVNGSRVQEHERTNEKGA